MEKYKDDNFEGVISITRSNQDYMSIRVVDSKSKGEFLDIRMSMEDFANAITGLSRVPVFGEVRGLSNIGKVRVVEARQAICPQSSYDKKYLSSWIEENCQEEGWIISTYLGSQTSIRHVTNGTLLNYSVVKYVEAE